MYTHFLCRNLYTRFHKVSKKYTHFLKVHTFSKGKTVPLSPAMDPSDDVKPSPPKKHRTDYSDAKKAAFTNNFEKRHKKKGRARMVHP